MNRDYSNDIEVPKAIAHLLAMRNNTPWVIHPIGGLWKRLITHDSEECQSIEKCIFNNSIIQVQSRCWIVEDVDEEPYYQLRKIPNVDAESGTMDDCQQFSVQIGSDSIIPAWDLAVLPLTTTISKEKYSNARVDVFSPARVGDHFELLTTSLHAYGEHGSPPNIPGNATLLFDIKILSREKEAGTTKEMIQVALSKKDRGNLFFQRNEIKQADILYEEALSKLRYVFPDMEEDRKYISEIKLVCNNNRAACQLIALDFFGAKASCDNSLYIDPSNVKALYRRSQALCALGNYDRSKRDIVRAIKLAPNEISLRDELSHIKQKEADYEAKSKAMYARMGKLS